MAADSGVQELPRIAEVPGLPAAGFSPCLPEAPPDEVEFRSTLRIGGVSLALSGGSREDTRLSPGVEEFRADRGDSDIEIQVHWAQGLRAWQGEPAFDSGGLWKLFRRGQDYAFDFCSPSLGVHPYKRLITDQAFHSSQLILSREALGKRAIFPLEYPIDELLVTNYLASSLRGVEVHGCGLVDSENGGHLFLGHSGAGKSTTAALWKSLRRPEILSDDRVILRLHDGELWMYGTPWHGEAAFASAAKARLNRILILQHGERNEMTEISRSQAVGELFARCFPPFHSAAGLENTVEFLHQVIDTVPCYEFRFVPNPGAVEAVLGFDG